VIGGALARLQGCFCGGSIVLALSTEHVQRDIQNRPTSPVARPRSRTPGRAAVALALMPMRQACRGHLDAILTPPVRWSSPIPHWGHSGIGGNPRMDRRALIARSAGLAGAGLLAGAMPLAELVQASQPGSIDVGTFQRKVREVKGAAAHSHLERKLARLDAHFGPEGGLIQAESRALLRSVITNSGQRGLAHIEVEADGHTNAAAVIVTGRTSLLVGVRAAPDGKVVASEQRAEQGVAPALFVPPGYLELPAGASIVNTLPSLTPPAGAQALNCAGCVLQTSYICWSVPGLICGPTVCTLIVALACGLVSAWVCGPGTHAC